MSSFSLLWTHNNCRQFSNWLDHTIAPLLSIIVGSDFEMRYKTRVWLQRFPSSPPSEIHIFDATTGIDHILVLLVALRIAFPLLLGIRIRKKAIKTPLWPSTTTERHVMIAIDDRFLEGTPSIDPKLPWGREIMTRQRPAKEEKTLYSNYKIYTSIFLSYINPGLSRDR